MGRSRTRKGKENEHFSNGHGRQLRQARHDPPRWVQQLDAFYRKYREELIRLVIRVAGMGLKPEEAADVVHDSVAITIEKVLDGEQIRSLRSYLKGVVRIVAKRAITQKAKEQRRCRALNEEDCLNAEGEPTCEGGVMERIELALRECEDEEERNTMELCLRLLGGKDPHWPSARQIAETVGIGRTKAKRLRKIVQEKMQELAR